MRNTIKTSRVMCARWDGCHLISSNTYFGSKRQVVKPLCVGLCSSVSPVYCLVWLLSSALSKL